MTSVFANMTMSLDGFVSHPTDGASQIFQWYGAGPVAVPTADPDLTFHTSEASARHLRAAFDGVGALVYGRRTFEVAGGWVGGHPVGAPIVVVTHSVPDGWPRPEERLSFTDNLGEAVARARDLAGDKNVAIGSADLTQQCLNAGILDELYIDLVPVMLGAGTRFFENLEGTPYRLEQIEVVEGLGVTHLAYRVLKR